MPHRSSELLPNKLGENFKLYHGQIPLLILRREKEPIECLAGLLHTPHGKQLDRHTQPPSFG